MNKHCFLFGTLLCLLVSCTDDTPFNVDRSSELRTLLQAQGGTDQFLLPDSDDFDNIPQDPRNPLTAEKVRLGQLLFHETGIGVKALAAANVGTYSCASCHFARAGFQAGRFQGIGEGGEGFGARGEGRLPLQDLTDLDLDVQPIRTPAALNTAYQDVMLWNGQFGATGTNAGTEAGWTTDTPKEKNHLGFQGVETQAVAGLGVHRLHVDRGIVDSLGYTAFFDAAFPELPPEERYELIPAALAIAAYERTLLANRAPWQAWLQGNEAALDPQEMEGALLFFGKAGCSTCHTGPALNSMTFAALGMDDLHNCPEPTFRTRADNGENLGRGGFTGVAADNYKFKVPQLYSLRHSPFYGHGSSFRSVRDVVAYKNAAVPQNPAVPAEQFPATFQPLGLTELEVDALTAFIEQGLHDPALSRYEPEALPSGSCFPNHDPRSRSELNCE